MDAMKWVWQSIEVLWLIGKKWGYTRGLVLSAVMGSFKALDK
jgi:hypothetical protein